MPVLIKKNMMSILVGIILLLLLVDEDKTFHSFCFSSAICNIYCMFRFFFFFFFFFLQMLKFWKCLTI